MKLPPPTRRELLVAAGLGLTGLAAHAAGPPADPLGLRLSEAQLAAGVAHTRHHPSVDMHCHPGRFFLAGIADPPPRIAAYGAPFAAKAIDDMTAGRVGAALLSCVSDTLLLDFSPTRGLFASRSFAPGEAFADYRRQIGVLQKLVTDGAVAPGTRPGDIAAALHRHRIAGVFAVEGGDFLEDDLDRVHVAHADGVRSITIVHYTVNQIGDIQTEAEQHGGLTSIGRTIVREMNKAGIIVDLSHASARVVRDTIDIATRPVLASHTNISRPDFTHPRLISPETARLIAATGGVIGANPSGIGQKTMRDWIDSIFYLIDMVGIDHVGIGTDMDANYQPVFGDYGLWPTIPAALLARGASDADAAKIMGGNFLRLYRAVSK